MTPATLYTWTLLILTGPLLLALAALLRHQRPTSRSDKLAADAQHHSARVRARLERLGLRLLLLQTIVPFLQFLTNLRSTAVPPSSFEVHAVMVLALLAFAVCPCTLYLLIRYTRGTGRLLLPLLSLGAFVCSALLFLAQLATA